MRPDLPSKAEYNKMIFISEISNRQTVKMKIEKELAGFIWQEGYTAIKSVDVFRQDFPEDWAWRNAE